MALTCRDKVVHAFRLTISRNGYAEAVDDATAYYVDGMNVNPSSMHLSSSSLVACLLLPSLPLPFQAYHSMIRYTSSRRSVFTIPETARCEVPNIVNIPRIDPFGSCNQSNKQRQHTINGERPYEMM